MTDVRSMIQTALDGTGVYVHWQRRVEIPDDPNPDEYVVYTLGGDYNRKWADGVPLVKEAEATVRYYHRADKLGTAAGRTAVKSREETLLAALRGAGFSCPSGAFDAGDIDDNGFDASVIPCAYGRVV